MKGIKIKKRRERSSVFLKLFLFFTLSLVLVVPLVRLFAYLISEPKSIKRVILAENFREILFNSLTVTLIATAITMFIAVALAMCIYRTNIKFKWLFSAFVVLPMLIPSISHGMGLIILFGPSGIFTQLFNFNIGIYGMKGIIIGSVLYACPVAFLMISDVMKYEDGTSYEAAEILGFSKRRRFTAITLPYLKRPFIITAFSIFAMIITDYGVPLTIGGKYVTIPKIMYQDVISGQEFGKGSVYALILLVPAFLAFIIDMADKENKIAGFVSKRIVIKKNSKRDALGYLICIVISVCALLPIAAFLVLSFTQSYPNDMTFSAKHIVSVFSMNGGKYLFNSVIIALCTAILGSAFAFTAAYLTARSKRFSKPLHLLSLMSMSIPGLVLGLSYIIFFSGTWFTGTLIILIMVNMVHFISSPYLMMYNYFNKKNENIEAVGETLGINKLRIVLNVFLPQSIGTLFEMFSYLFVNCMMTISAVSFLATTANKPVSLMINQFEAQIMFESVAVVSIAILIVNITIKAIIYFLKKYLSGEKHDNKKTV